MIKQEEKTLFRKMNIEQKLEYLRPLINKYFIENNKLDIRGINKCDYLPSVCTINNIIHQYFNKQINMYEAFSINVPSEFNKYLNRKPYTYKEMKKIFEDNGCVLLSTEFKNTNSKVDFICSCGNKSKVIITNFIQGQLCRKCKYSRNHPIKPKKEKLQMYSNKKHTYEYLYNFYLERGCTLLSPYTDYKNMKSKLTFICKCGDTYTSSFASFKLSGNCRQCGIRSKDKHYAWKGGISPLHEYLRKHICDWKNNSLRQCNYKCVITARKTDVIHHLYSFNKILDEAIQITKLDLRDSIEKYSFEELDLLVQICNQLHKKYGLGVCLNKKIHKLYHDIYKNDNIPEQFEEFKIRLKSGELNLFLEENNLRLII